MAIFTFQRKHYQFAQLGIQPFLIVFYLTFYDSQTRLILQELCGSQPPAEAQAGASGTYQASTSQAQADSL